MEVRPAYIYNPGLVTAWHYVTGVMSVIMFINASLVASALAVKEKETGTIEQLLMTPAQTGEMLLAKTTPVFLLMMVVMFVALITGVLVFGLPVRGEIWMFAVAGACAALAGIGIGVMVATVSKSQQQAQLADVLSQSADYAAFGSDFPDREHAGVFPEALVLRPASVSGNDRSRRHLERRPVERAVAESGYLVGVCCRSVFDQRLAVPKAVKRRTR